jgi:hypothetical protein
MTETDQRRRVDSLVVEFPDGTMQGAGLALLADMVEAGAGRVLDLVFVRKDADDALSVIDVSQLLPDARLALAVLMEAFTGQLDHLDIAAAGVHIDPGSSAGIIVFESSSVGPDVDPTGSNPTRVTPG